MTETREYQKAIDYLCRQIAAGELEIGSKLPTERRMAEILSIGRNSVREAIRMLENMGIVESRRGSGNYLVENTSKTISRIMDMMLLLRHAKREEIYSFRRNMEKAVCRAILETPTRRHWCAQMEQLLTTTSDHLTAEEEFEQDRHFHSMLFQATENQFWISLMEAISEVYRRWIDIVLRQADDTMKECLHETHLAIVHALQQGDWTACEAAIDRHYDSVEAACFL